MIKIQSLNQNKQFLSILKKKRINNNYFTIYYGKNNDEIKKNLRSSFVNINSANRSQTYKFQYYSYSIF